MKFLLDFDGVLTELNQEAMRVRQLFAERLLELSDAPMSEVLGWIESIETLMRASPESHGWRIDGRISAFVNEDLFVRTNATAFELDRTPELEWVKERLNSQGYSGFEEVAQECYEKMTRETRAGGMNPVETTALNFLKMLDKAGHRVVIVSNSETRRILDLLHRSQLDMAVDHSSHPKARFRVRGGARKFGLSQGKGRCLQVGVYSVAIDRPDYEKILREEKPDVVIGDVFSLDLALPLYLKKNEPKRFGKIMLYLREREYTPYWSGSIEEINRIPRTQDLSSILRDPGFIS